MKNSAWKSYEEVAAHLLNEFANEFGLSHVEGAQSVHGDRSNTKWAIDAKAFLENEQGFLIVECRRYISSKQNQERIGALAYRIIDTGAAGGIIVSPTGLQSGAEKVAQAENILCVTLDAQSTPYEFGMQFLNKVFVGFQAGIALSDSFEVEHLRVCTQCNQKFIVHFDELICITCLQTA